MKVNRMAVHADTGCFRLVLAKDNYIGNVAELKNKIMETLINLHPKTDFEKLLFCYSYIEELKLSLKLERIERGKLDSEVDHLNAELRKMTNQLNQLRQCTKEERNAVKGEHLYKQQNEYRVQLERTIRLLRQDRDVLISKINA